MFWLRIKKRKFFDLGIVDFLLKIIPNFSLIFRLKREKWSVFGYHWININLIPKNSFFLGIRCCYFLSIPKRYNKVSFESLLIFE